MTDSGIAAATQRAFWPWRLPRPGPHAALAFRLTLSMIAAGLLAVTVVWRVLFPAETEVAALIAGVAATVVAVPVLSAGVSSLISPDLHGITDRLVAIAFIAAAATGDMTTAAVLPIVMILAHVLEERSLLSSQAAIRSLGRLVEASARRLVGDDGAVEVVSTRRLAAGDAIELRAGDRIPADGIVRDGTSSIDTASLTGESVPVDVVAGDPVLAGSINLDGRLVVNVTRVGGETTLGKIIALMRQAEQAKPPITRLLERYAGAYITLILIIAAGVWFASADTAAMLAVLVASCPCALILAAPATAIAAIAVAARHGILIKGSGFLERLAEVTSIVFDKTGTVTRGQLTVVGVVPSAGQSRETLAQLAAAIGATSNHPVSRALAGLAPDGARLPLVEARETQGFGVTARIGDQAVALGRPALFERLGIAVSQIPDHDGPLAGLSRGGEFMGWLLLADQARPEAEWALDDLRSLGLERQVLLTGDRETVARRIAAQLRITDVTADVLPEQKMARVLQEIDQGFQPLVVGDGINDALALKAGAVGVAMGAQGTDVALASADLVLMTSDLCRLGTAIRLSRRCRRTIHVNVAIGLVWTVILVVLAASGILGHQGALIAAVVHNFSTFAGMANAGRLLSFDEMHVSPSPREPVCQERAEG
ncbi:MAG: cation-translocating P-type ATPase [Azospirillaceae bacterium]|nr:cation-translocating P-type ATPase [Azospirillaceae bacterium]